MKIRSVLLTALLIAGIAGMALSSYAVVTSLTIHQTGTISMVQAFYDSACLQKVTTIDWGTIYPNNQTIVLNQTVWVKNFGTNAVNVTLITTNWTPAVAPQYMATSWSREGEIISGGMTLSAQIFLTVYANVSQSSLSTFSSDITISENW